MQKIRVKGLGIQPGTRVLSLEIGDVIVSDFGAWAVVVGLGEKTALTRRITFRWASGTPNADPTTEFTRSMRVGTLILVMSLADRIERLQEREQLLRFRSETYSHSAGWNDRARRVLKDVQAELRDALETHEIMAA